MNDCTLYELQLMDLAAGELTEPDLGAVRKHLQQCADCSAELAREIQMRELLGGLPAAACPEAVTNRLQSALPLGADRTGNGRSSWWPAGLGLVAAALLAVLLIPGWMNRTVAPESDLAQSEIHEFTDAEISQARRDVIATLALAADILERSREETVADVFGARLPRIINGSLRSPLSDAQGTTDNLKTAPTGGNG